MCPKTLPIKSRNSVKSSGTTGTARLKPPTGATATVVNSGAPIDLQRVRSGDPSAWDEILRRYGKLVYATVRSFQLQEADVLDAVQTTWLRLAENAHQIQNPERLGAWLTTTARRECLRIVSQAKRAARLTDMVADAVVDPSAEPERRVIDLDAARRIWAFVNELSPRQRCLLRALFTDDPRPYAKVADITGIPVGAIGPTRRRALAQLRGRLERPQCQVTSRISRKHAWETKEAHAESFEERPIAACLHTGNTAAQLV
jgi:RNA polymerase sigma factor (sigma-70 family)